MEINPTRMCELLVGLPAVTVLGVDDEPDGPLVVHWSLKRRGRDARRAARRRG